MMVTLFSHPITLFWIFIVHISHSYDSNLNECHATNESNDCQKDNTSQRQRIDCDPESGWQCDYQPDFSHRNGDHAFCDLDIVSLDDKLT